MSDEQRPSEVWPALFISERLAAKDAEIEILKSAMKEDITQAARASRLPSAEVERLLTKHAKEQNVLLIALEAATQTIQMRNKLITELCDALDVYQGVKGANSYDNLIQRAREATR